MPRKGDERGAGAVVEVRFADGVWYRGRLVERVAGTEPPCWKVRFDDGELRDDILLGNPNAPVRFDDSAYGSTVEVRFDGEWYRGRLVQLVSGSDVWGVTFENGDWAKDVRLGDPDVRYVFAEGAKRGRNEDAGEDAGQEGKMVRAKGAGRSGGRGERQEGRGGSATGGVDCEMCRKGFSAPSNWLHTCGHIQGKGRMSARRAASLSRRPATCLGTCGYIQGKCRMSASRAARRSPRPATWLCTCAYIRGRRGRMSA